MQNKETSPSNLNQSPSSFHIPAPEHVVFPDPDTVTDPFRDELEPDSGPALWKMLGPYAVKCFSLFWIPFTWEPRRFFLWFGVLYFIAVSFAAIPDARPSP